ncbi:MAG TPA: hypothetical protein VFO72_03070 [Pyrinomonadaceae bacterium]|nr:hypothetical protein [Pyrinomonadaceae bacterium]
MREIGSPEQEIYLTKDRGDGIVWAFEVGDKGPQLFTLLVREIDKTQAKTDCLKVMGHFAGQLEPGAVRELDPESQLLTDIGLAEGIDKTSALREVGDPRRAFEGAAPNGIQTNLQSLFTAAVVHIMETENSAYQD